MAEQGRDATLPWPAIVGLLTAIAGVVSFIPPLTSSRPPVGAQRIVPTLGDQKVDARLWQDPFEAVLRATGSEDWMEANDGAWHKDLFLQRVLLKDEPKVIAVMLGGGPFAGDAEERIRTRHAVVTSIGWAGYAPEDPDHIGLLKLKGARTRNEATAVTIENLRIAWRFWPFVHLKSPAPIEMLVPFEVWRPRGRHLNESTAAKPDLLILWLREESFTERPMHRLAQLRKQLGDTKAGHRRAMTVIGPHHSSALREMVLDAVKIAADLTVLSELRAELSQIRVLSPWATVADDVLQVALEKKWTSISELFNEIGLKKFTRTTATDDVLATTLLDELDLRNIGVRPTSACEPGDPIAIVTEWDSVYARSLTSSFGAAVLSKTSKPSVAAIIRNETSWPSRVHQFSYLRGIDGRLPGEPVTQATGKPDEPKKEISTIPGERPEGRDQADYLRRLVNGLTELDKTYRAENFRGHGLRAIGIFGSDVYDKLLILRALRQSFPGVVFFTTDLDARYLTPEQFPYTRNLVVAAPYGLTLSASLQRILKGDFAPYQELNIAPFRDNYQSAVFLAALLAVWDKPVDLNFGDARRFEIGRGMAVDLSVSETRAERSLHPAAAREVPATFFWSRRFWLTLVALMLAVIFAVWHKKWRLDELWRVARDAWTLFALFIVMIAIGIVVWLADHPSRGEPFAVFQGISIWPTEIARGVAIYLSVVFLAYIGRCMHSSDRDCVKKFELDDPSPEPNPLMTFANVRSHWRQHVDASAKRNRWTRIITASASYLAFGASWFFILGFPHAPTRGWLSFCVDQVIMPISVVLQILLVFYVLDIVRQGEWIITKIADLPSRWPPLLVDAKLQETKMDSEDLADVLDVRFAAVRTQAIGRIVYLPFVILFLLIFARNRYFDNFDWPISLVLVLGLNCMLMIYAYNRMRSAAERMRRKELERLRARLYVAAASPDTAKGRRASLELAIAEIERERRGAFQPFLQQPIVVAALIPFSGLGLWAILQYVLSAY